METTRPAPPRSSLVVAVAVAAALVLAACTDSDPSTVESGDGAGDGAAPAFSFQPLDPGAITVTALEQGSIDIAVLFSTNAAIAANDWVVLEDDKELQGAENIVPLVRTEVVNGPAVDALDGVSEALTTEAITELNRRVEADREDPEAVARDYAESEGLLDIESPEGSGPLTVGSFNFTESQILAHLYAHVLRAHGYEVSVEANLGAREQVVFPAIERGELDIVPEYVQSLLVLLAGGDVEALPVDEGVERVEELLPEGLELLEPSEAQDQNALVVTAETAEEYDLEAVSDLAEVDEPLVLGGPPECAERPQCLLGYEEVYGLRFDR
ncbi:MAG TPA: glycine betaine ABC transporter substrate-binding protein [Acidimicrobiales bacterium]|jgi:glycine betaine/choline ABC-type transport system substrate-binding protein|nr:glycine betaine ABC transporter substrate-binding protein [Acidimicrobiales bacterium]